MLRSGQRVTVQGTIIKPAEGGDAAYTVVLSDGSIKDFRLYEIKEDNDDDSVDASGTSLLEDKMKDIVRVLSHIQEREQEMTRREEAVQFRLDILEKEDRAHIYQCRAHIEELEEKTGDLEDKCRRLDVLQSMSEGKLRQLMHDSERVQEQVGELQNKVEELQVQYEWGKMD